MHASAPVQYSGKDLAQHLQDFFVCFYVAAWQHGRLMVLFGLEKTGRLYWLVLPFYFRAVFYYHQMKAVL
jgi:hypothetical protein